MDSSGAGNVVCRKGEHVNCLHDKARRSNAGKLDLEGKGSSGRPRHT